jgi:hypothetical protein
MKPEPPKARPKPGLPGQAGAGTSLIPFKTPEENLFFVCNKMGLDVAFLGGAQEIEEEDIYEDIYV